MFFVHQTKDDKSKQVATQDSKNEESPKIKRVRTNGRQRRTVEHFDIAIGDESEEENEDDQRLKIQENRAARGAAPKIFTQAPPAIV